MFVKVFFVVIMLSSILMNYFIENRNFTYCNGRILLTSISINDVDDVDVQNLIAKGKKNFRLITLIFLIYYCAMFLLDLDNSMMFSVIGIFVYMGITTILLNSYIKEMRRIKKEKNFTVFSKKFVDLKTSVEVNKRQYSLTTWLIPIFMYVVDVVGMYFIFKIESPIIFITNFILLLSIIGLGIVLRKMPVKIVSENSEVNISVNILRKVKLQEIVFYFSCLLVVVLSLVNYFSQIDEFLMPIFLIGIVVLMVLFTIYFFYYSIRINREIMDKFEDEKFVVTEDDYFDMLGYNNPNDSRIMVQDPINPTKFVLNRGNKKGRALFSVSMIALAFSIVLMFYLIVPSKFEVKYVENGFKITSKMYSDNVDFSNIESINLIDELPKGKWIKTDGNAMDYQSYGNFKNSEIGDIRLYSFNKVGKYIEIKLKKGKPIFINQETEEKTVKLYEELKQKN